MTTLASALQAARPEAAAVVVPDGPTVTYRALTDEVEQTAERLAAAGLVRGRTVSIVLPNSLEFVVTFLAVARAGAIAAPLNPAYTADEFDFFIDDANSSLAIISEDADTARAAAEKQGVPVMTARTTDDGATELASSGTPLANCKDVAPPDPEDVALFLHTSGTTSRPKGVPLTHANLVASLANIRGTYELTPDDVAIVVMPLFHVHGLLGVALSTLTSGGTIVLPDRFSAGAFWGVQEETGATWYSAVPTIHQVLLLRADDDGAPHSSFRFIRSCSSALAPSVHEDMERRFGAPVLEAYGMTEASHQMSSNPLPPGTRIPGTVGAGTGVDIAIMDEAGTLLAAGESGEVAIRGPNVTHGYANNPEANAEAYTDGWFRTGDQGFLAEDGYLTLTGRLKELINRGGEKISPLEVDAVLLRHDAVTEAVSFAVPDTKYGEVVHAAVVLAGVADEEGLRAFCRDYLAAFKVPDRIYVADQLPRTATGKIQRRHVAAAFVEED